VGGDLGRDSDGLATVKLRPAGGACYPEIGLLFSPDD